MGFNSAFKGLKSHSKQQGTSHEDRLRSVWGIIVCTQKWQLKKKRLNYVFCGGCGSQMARRSKDGSPSWYAVPFPAPARWRKLDIMLQWLLWRKGLRIWTEFTWLRNCCEHGDELRGSINGRNLYKIWDVKPCRLALVVLDCSTLNMKTTRSFETSLTAGPTTQCHIFIWARGVFGFLIIAVPTVNK